MVPTKHPPHLFSGTPGVLCVAAILEPAARPAMWALHDDALTLIVKRYVVRRTVSHNSLGWRRLQDSNLYRLLPRRFSKPLRYHYGKPPL